MDLINHQNKELKINCRLYKENDFSNIEEEARILYNLMEPDPIRQY